MDLESVDKVDVFSDELLELLLSALPHSLSSELLYSDTPVLKLT